MKRIWEYNPEIKLIAILRNSIDRTSPSLNNEAKGCHDFLRIFIEEQD